MCSIAFREADQVQRPRALGVCRSRLSYQGQLPQQQTKPGASAVRGVAQEILFSGCRDGGVGEIASGEHCQLVLVIDHVVILAGGVELLETVPGLLENAASRAVAPELRPG